MPCPNQPESSEPDTSELDTSHAESAASPAAVVAGWLKRFGLVFALAIIVAALGVAKPNSLSSGNLIIVARQISINGILAVGVTFVLLAGGVDLSLGSLVALTGVIAAHFAHPGDYPLIVPLFMGIAAGTL